MVLFTFCNPKELRIETRVVLEGSLQDVFPGKRDFLRCQRTRAPALFQKANDTSLQESE
jgi:hypothetical protein